MKQFVPLLFAAPFLSGGVCSPTLMGGGDPRLDSLQLPPGFRIEVFADRVPNARAMTLSNDGVVYVGSREEGAVYALPDKDHNGKADTMFVIANGLRQPVGVTMHGNDLYVSAIDRILALRDIGAHLADPPAPELITDRLPKETHHGWKFIAFGPDGKLYVPIGAPCNVCLKEDSIFATITRMDPNGSNMEIVAHGVRNTVGFDWDPRDGSLWFTENGRDWMGDDLPHCELDHLTAKGQHFGFPFCHQGDVLDPEFGKGKDCASYVKPMALLGPHVAPLGMRFYRGSMFPSEYRNAMFIAEHGSWNRSTPIGYRIVVAFPQADGSVRTEIFADGWLNGKSAWGRPADVLELPDGSLLVSDDEADMIYRVTYAKP